MDITAMDVLIDENGDEFILEINSSAIGLNPRYQEEDSLIIRDLVIRRFESTNQKEKNNSIQPPSLTKEAMSNKISQLELEVKQLQEKLSMIEKQQKTTEEESQKTKKTGGGIFKKKK